MKTSRVRIGFFLVGSALCLFGADSLLAVWSKSPSYGTVSTSVIAAIVRIGSTMATLSTTLFGFHLTCISLLLSLIPSGRTGLLSKYPEATQLFDSFYASMAELTILFTFSVLVQILPDAPAGPFLMAVFLLGSQIVYMVAAVVASSRNLRAVVSFAQAVSAEELKRLDDERQRKNLAQLDQTSGPPPTAQN